jgi:hypothetical protein
VLTYNAGTIIFGAHATATLESTTPLRRMLRSGITVLAALVLLAAYVFLHQLGPSVHAGDAAPKTPRADGQAVFPALLAVAAVMAAATAYLQSAVVALSSTFGARPMGLMLAGQGVVVSVAAQRLCWHLSDKMRAGSSRLSHPALRNAGGPG